MPVRTADINNDDNNIEFEILLLLLFAIVYQTIRTI